MVWIELSLMNQERGSQINPEMSLRICNQDTLDGIGREFHMKRYRPVSSVVQRMRATISKGRKLIKIIETLRAQVNMSQE